MNIPSELNTPHESDTSLGELQPQITVAGMVLRISREFLVLCSIFFSILFVLSLVFGAVLWIVPFTFVLSCLPLIIMQRDERFKNKVSFCE